MKARSLLRPIFTRSYATRLPQRPPARFPDPLKKPEVVHQPLPDTNLTFIHRPPPSAPSPLSYTTVPASPLLRKEVTPISALPPVLRNKPEGPRMSDENIAKLKALRAEDPVKWSRRRLAKEFDCTPSFVMRVAALKAGDKKKALGVRDEEHQENRDKWGEKKSLQVAIRQKRRQLW